MSGLFALIAIYFTSCVAHVPLHDHDSDRDNAMHRVKRATPEETERLQNLSPTDRPSCKPGSLVPSTRVDTTARLEALRAEFTPNGIHGYYIPSEDAHQSEYPSDYDMRRLYISGVSGSSGRAVVLGTKAALWTDGRYFLQAEDQLDCNWILMKQGEHNVPGVTEWVKANLQNGEKLGVSPFLIMQGTWKWMNDELTEAGRGMQEVTNDLIDQTWTTGRPAQPNTDIFVLPMKFTGRSWQDKVTNVQAAMEYRSVDVMVVTGLDETAWLFNLRASDIQYNPFFLSYAILNRVANTTTLYIKDVARKLDQDPADPESTEKVKDSLNTNSDGSCVQRDGMCVQVKEYNHSTLLSDIGTAVASVSGKIWVSTYCNYAIYNKIFTSAGSDKERIRQALTPMARYKAQKNPVEAEGLKNAHIRDAVALITFMAKLEKEVKEGKYWTEVSAAEDLKQYRAKQKYNRGLSFAAIAGSGSNGAVIHYVPTNETDKQITTDQMFLLDSGGQYLDGTTDITRTFHFGNPTDFQKECYTRVLMGHVNMAKIVWKSGLYGRFLEILARQPIWEAGLHYRHGSGHGIGMFLSVHEGPGFLTMSTSSFDGDEQLKERQFFSNEPGYYEDGEFGIRLETIVMVTEADTKYHFPGTRFLGFEAIVLVPFEPHLIDVNLLNQKQVDWINDYNARTQSTIGPLVESDPVAKEWLSSRTRKISLNNSTGSASSMLASFFFIVACLGTLFVI